MFRLVHNIIEVFQIFTDTDRITVPGRVDVELEAGCPGRTAGRVTSMTMSKRDPKRVESQRDSNLSQDRSSLLGSRTKHQ